MSCVARILQSRSSAAAVLVVLRSPVVTKARRAPPRPWRRRRPNRPRPRVPRRLPQSRLRDRGPPRRHSREPKPKPGPNAAPAALSARLRPRRRRQANPDSGATRLRLTDSARCYARSAADAIPTPPFPTPSRRRSSPRPSPSHADAAATRPPASSRHDQRNARSAVVLTGPPTCVGQRVQWHNGDTSCTRQPRTAAASTRADRARATSGPERWSAWHGRLPLLHPPLDGRPAPRALSKTRGWLMNERWRLHVFPSSERRSRT
jgi:hypothetical protein